MEDSSLRPRPPYLSYLFLAGLTVWFIAFHRGAAIFEDDRAIISLMLPLAVYVAFWLEWSIHGLLPAMTVAVLLLFAPPPQLPGYDPFLPIAHFTQMLLLAVLGLMLVVWSELARDTFRPVVWTAIACGLWAIGAMIWIEVARMQTIIASRWADYGGGFVNKASPALFLRTYQSTLAFLILGGLWGVWFASSAQKKRTGARRWTKSMSVGYALLLLTPFAGFAAATSSVQVAVDSLWNGTNWEEHVETLRITWREISSGGSGEGWSWATPRLLVPLMVLGFWRTIGRGHRQWKQGRMPLAWLLMVLVVFSLLVGFPVLLSRHGALTVVFLGAVLPVFAVADFALLFYERIVLPTPRIGPSDVPHIPHP